MAPWLVFVIIRNENYSTSLLFNDWDGHIILSLKWHLQFSTWSSSLKRLNACTLLSLTFTTISLLFGSFSCNHCLFVVIACLVVIGCTRCSMSNQSVCRYLWMYIYVLSCLNCPGLGFLHGQHNFSKMINRVFTLFYLHIFCINFTLQFNIFILDGLCLYGTMSQIIFEQCNCLFMFFNRLLILLLYFLQHHFWRAILPRQLLWAFLDCIAISIAPSKSMKTSCGFLSPPNLPNQVLVKPTASTSDFAWVLCNCKSLKLSLFFSKCRGWYCTSNSVSIAPAVTSWNKEKLIFYF